ncbi:hypothetical protein SAMN05519226_1044 [Cycloclasticus pugetii]|jgi:hypothetical protein|nr:hypothetical protein SAMN05519226_1044 [Cycloclasticus pugetii]
MNYYPYDIKASMENVFYAQKVSISNQIFLAP